MNPDPYYKRSEVSNSDLTELKYTMHPQLNFISEQARKKAFHLGTLVDALITEPSACNHFRKTVNDEAYTADEWKWGKQQLDKLRKAASSDQFLDYVYRNAETQRWFANQHQKFDLGCYTFELPTRCKFDWFLGTFGGDLKTVSATTQDAFTNAIDIFDWDRSRAWYMDILHAINPEWGNQDFIYGISKTTNRVFFQKIIRGDQIYISGRDKYLELAFMYWTLT